MEDIQSLADDRQVPLEQVGISDLRLPVKILEQAGGYQHVSAEIGLFVEVPATVRGTHLSRFVEVLHEWVDRPVASGDMKRLLEETKARAHSVSAETEISFPFFMAKPAPVSGRIGMVDYQCRFFGRADEDGFAFELGVRVPVTTLCPCSRAISDHGAHNQRAIVQVAIRPTTEGFVWLEELIAIAEAQASCPVYSVLKREDEKWVTEHAYETPKFVEDVVRDTVLTLAGMEEIFAYSVRCESVESIHNHNAMACVGWTVRQPVVGTAKVPDLDALVL